MFLNNFSSIFFTMFWMISNALAVSLALFDVEWKENMTCNNKYYNHSQLLSVYHMPGIVFTVYLICIISCNSLANYVMYYYCSIWQTRKQRLLSKAMELVRSKAVWLQSPALNHQGTWPALSNLRTTDHWVNLPMNYLATGTELSTQQVLHQALNTMKEVGD